MGSIAGMSRASVCTMTLPYVVWYKEGELQGIASNSFTLPMMAWDQTSYPLALK